MALNEKYIHIGRDIIGSAFEVRKNSGKGLREHYYKHALACELTALGYKVEIEGKIEVKYKGEIITDAYKADLVINDCVIIETKAITHMYEDQFRQLYTYLHLSKYELGYLINFGAEDFSIGKLKGEHTPFMRGIYRMICDIKDNK